MVKVIGGRNYHMLALAGSIAVILLAGSLCEASIENEPVKVTHRNSGPSYDIDNVERTRLNPDENTISTQPQQANQGAPEQQDGEPAIGHLTIRRIFLVPMMPQQDSVWTRSQREGAPSSQPEQPRGSDELPSLFSGRPFWPFMAAPSADRHHEHEHPQPPPHRHLIGADEASRPPMNEAASNERPSAERSPPQPDSERDESMERLRPMFDPIRMMMDLMQQALNPTAGGPGGLFEDTGKEAAQPMGDKDNKEAASEKALSTEVTGRPIKPAANETKEEIVEIDGKKYLRKTVINRHVGENIIFMTRRLIFVPLNETDSELASTTTTTTAAPSSTTLAAEPIADNASSSGPKVDKEVPVEPKAEQPTTTTTTTTSSPPSTSAAPSEPLPTVSNVASSEAPPSSTSTTQMPSSTRATESEETTPRLDGWTEKVAEAVDRIAERIVELGVSSTVKPAVAEQATRQSS